MTGDPSRSLRIGMIAPGYPTGGPGDYRGIFVKMMVDQLKARGHRVCVLSSAIRPGDEPFTQVDDAEEVHRFRFWSEGKLIGEYQRIPPLRMMSYLISATLAGRRIFGRYGVDLVHSHFLVPMGPVGAAVALKLRKPHLITGHGREVHMAARKRIVRPLAHWAIRHAQALTATADHLIPPYLSLGAREQDIVKLPMGIHGPFLEPLPADHGQDPAGMARILSTRTLLENPYNVSQLVRAMRLVADRHPQAHCTLAGDGADRPLLENLVKELGLGAHVTFVGWADPGRLAELLRAHRLYVSTMRADGASVSLFEAMACGAYPILTDTPPNREWVRHGDNGQLFAMDDPQALADAIDYAMTHPEAVARATAQNRATAVESVTWPGLAARLEKVYRSMLGQADD